jgi:uncharacterized protein
MKHFHSPSKGRLTFADVIEELLEFVEHEPANTYSVVVGSDSEQGVKETEYITAIVIHRHGKGGRYFWSREIKPNKATLRDRIWKETTLSTDLAKQIVDEFQARGNGFRKVQIHVDIGENGPTRELIKEICGFVKGVGFSVRIKPQSYAACAVADKLI